MDYYGVVPGQNTRISKITKWGVALVAVYMGWQGIRAGYWYYIPFALALIVFSFYRKDYVLNAKGVDLRRLFVLYTNHDVWTWDEVTNIIIDYEMMKPAAMLLICKGERKKRQFMMRAEDAKAAVKLAEKKNPEIIVEIQDADGRHREYQYNRSTRNERKAARAAEADAAKAGANGEAKAGGSAAAADPGTGSVSGAAPVTVMEDFNLVKEEIQKQKEREEQLQKYRRPDPKTARCMRPEKKLRGFH